MPEATLGTGPAEPMVLTVLLSVKGGQGCSVATGMLALSAQPNAVAIDASGDLGVVLGLGESPTAGLLEALLAHGPIRQLPVARLSKGLDFVSIGSGRFDDVPEKRWVELAHYLVKDPRHFIVDAGTGPSQAMARLADEALLVTRRCFLALRRAACSSVRMTGVVIVNEPGRVLSRTDVERAVRTPVVFEIPVLPEISRAVDAGLLTMSRLPAAAKRALHRGRHDSDSRTEPS